MICYDLWGLLDCIIYWARVSRAKLGLKFLFFWGTDIGCMKMTMISFVFCMENCCPQGERDFDVS